MPFSPGDPVAWSGPNPDVTDGNILGPVYLIENNGTVVEGTPDLIVLWANECQSVFAPDDPALIYVTVP